MGFPDYIVLAVYFLLITGIGVVSMRMVKEQEGFFMGGRSFGKIFQIFAAFGAGTGSQDPAAVGRTSFTSGLAGIWSVFNYLFVTPAYWITSVWNRRMRHITFGDFFAERYESPALGCAYMIFGIAFNMVYLALGFTAIGKVGAPLVGVESVSFLGVTMSTASLLVILCALAVLVYGVLGGLRAAYWTDFLQGVCIIILSIMLIPIGLRALVEKFGDPATMGLMDGFRYMHQQVPAEYFDILNSPRGGEFPFHYIIAITIMNLIAVVIQPHMVAVGGGSAKNEMSARIGLVVGNFLKRFCTVGWAITILIVLALMADNIDIAAALNNPAKSDEIWGIASRELLGNVGYGTVGLMLACLMAALMSSASCYMLVASGLVVRNFYAPYIDPNASEKTYVLVGRISGALVLAGGVLISLYSMDLFEQLKFAWELPLTFASIFWLGILWRRTSKWAAWLTVLFTTIVFFILPTALPKIMPTLVDNPQYVVLNDRVEKIQTRQVMPSDVGKRQGNIKLWERDTRQWLQQDASRTEADASRKFGPKPQPLTLNATMEDTFGSGGKPIYWKGSLRVLEGEEQRPLGDEDFEVLSDSPDPKDENIRVVRKQLRKGLTLRGSGQFNLDMLVYDALGVDLSTKNKATLETLRLPTRVILPFLVAIVLSLITPRCSKGALDRFYVKMKTPICSDPEEDHRELEKSYADPSRYNHKRLIPKFDLEIQRPTKADIVGFLVCVAVCFLFVWVAVLLANLGS